MKRYRCLKRQHINLPRASDLGHPAIVILNVVRELPQLDEARRYDRNTRLRSHRAWANRFDEPMGLRELPMSNHDRNGSGEPSRPVPCNSSSSLRRFVLGAVAGIGFGIIPALYLLRQASRDPTPTLTPHLFHAAHERWNAVAPPDYDIEVRVTGSQPAVYRVEVRDGEPQAAWRNGEPLTTRRTFGTWSVPGMFSTIGRDIEAVERHATGKAERFTPRLTLRAEFDPKYHFPKRYRRIQQWSTVEVAWEVVEFRVR